MAARASRTENQDAIDCAIVNMLADPKEVMLLLNYLVCIHNFVLQENVFSPNCFIKARIDIEEVHFLPFNPTEKRTALTYIDRDGKMHRVSKGAPEQVGIIISLMIIISNFTFVTSFFFLEVDPTSCP